MADSDTIFALSTPPGRSALAVFRMSGSQAQRVLQAMTKRPCPQPRVATLMSLCDPKDDSKLDDAVVTFYSGPASYTGEDTLELSVHGGRGVVSAVASALSRMEDVRAAEPGEFTRRAYRAGKFDLSQAEAIADLIDSETEFQRRQALRLLAGGLGSKAEAWRQRLLALAAELESALDFSDEGDVGALDATSLSIRTRQLASEIAVELELGQRSLKVREGFTVVIAGPPNAGKSTLFNRIAGSELAIVTEHAGTTRDLLKVNLDLDGVPVTLVDSAGMRASSDPVERIGIKRAREAVGSSDLVLWLNTGDAESIEEIEGPVLQVWSKADLFPQRKWPLAVAANDIESIGRLVEIIREQALAIAGDGSQGLVGRQRHVIALENAIAGLERMDRCVSEDQLELAAEEGRMVNRQFATLSGAFETEELLGEIFSRFCVGK